MHQLQMMPHEQEQVDETGDMLAARHPNKRISAGAHGDANAGGGGGHTSTLFAPHGGMHAAVPQARYSHAGGVAPHAMQVGKSTCARCWA